MTKTLDDRKQWRRSKCGEWVDANYIVHFHVDPVVGSVLRPQATRRYVNDETREKP